MIRHTRIVHNARRVSTRKYDVSSLRILASADFSARRTALSLILRIRATSLYERMGPSCDCGKEVVVSPLAIHEYQALKPGGFPYVCAVSVVHVDQQREVYCGCFDDSSACVAA